MLKITELFNDGIKIQTCVGAQALKLLHATILPY